MRLVYKYEGGGEVQVGDLGTLSDGEEVQIVHFREPHKPSSEGKVVVQATNKKDPWSRELYVSCINAEWIEREDRL